MNTYHIAFSYWSPMPGVITLPAESAEAAVEQLKVMAKDMKDLNIIQVVEAGEVKGFTEARKAYEQAVDDELLEYNPDKKPN